MEVFYILLAVCIFAFAMPAMASGLNTDFSEFPKWQRVMIEEVYTPPEKPFTGDLKPVLDEMQAKYRKITYRDWHHLYPAANYWPTRQETAKLKAADCKGFSEAEFFDLLELGVREADLEIAIVYVKDTGEQHAVVVVENKWVLDRRAERVITMDEFERFYLPIAYFNRIGWHQ